jgi:type III secretion protein J
MTARRARIAVLLCTLLLVGCKTQLNGGLTERAANEEVALLLHNGVPASREADPKTNTLTVWVEQDRFADAVDLLQAHGLPRQHYDSIADVFKGNGLITSPTEERARMVYALGEELSRSVSEIDGVLSAHVHIVLPDNDPLRPELPPSSASVFILYKPDSEVGQLVPQIKMLVANGVAGLTYDKVSVVLVPAAVAPDDAQPHAAEMEEVFGVWVSSASMPLLLTLAGGGGLLIAALVGVVSWLVWRARGTLFRRPGSLVLR